MSNLLRKIGAGIAARFKLSEAYLCGTCPRPK